MVKPGHIKNGLCILTKFGARIDINAGRTQHPRNKLILHLAPTAHEKQNKQYGDKFMHARRSVNDYHYVLSDFLFDVVTFLQVIASVVHKIMRRSLAPMAVVLKVSCLNSIQSPQDKPIDS